MRTNIVMLARKYNGKADPSGWLMSEKLDGIRAYWNGTRFLTRTGRRINAPAWFIAGLPSVPLDGELYAGRGRFEEASIITIGNADPAAWQDIRFHVFDAPDASGGFEQRLGYASRAVVDAPYAVLHPHVVCQSAEHLARELARVESLGGEGLMLRKSGSAYECRRSSSMLKVKSFDDAEAVVIGHNDVASLQCQLADGVTFNLTCQERLPIGSVVTFRYHGYTSFGCPRFATLMRSAANAWKASC